MLADLDQGYWGFGDAGDLIDNLTRTNLQQGLQSIEKEIDDKMAFGDVDGADRLRSEREEILTYLSSSIGLGHRTRKVPSTIDHARSSVTKRINDARKQIAHHHPALVARICGR